MRTATLNATAITETISIITNPQGKATSATVDVYFHFHNKDEEVLILGQVTVYGKQIAALDYLTSHIIVSGDFSIGKTQAVEGKPTLNIDNASITCCHNALQGSVNLVNCVGHVRKDIDHRHFENSQVAKLSVVMRGKTKDDSVWANVEAWGPQASLVERFIERNDQVAFSGAFVVNQYNGNTYLKLKADRFTLINSSRTSEPAPARNKQAPAPAPAYEVDDF